MTGGSSVGRPAPSLISLSVLTLEDRGAAAQFLARLNPLPEHQICYLGNAESEIAAELSAALPQEGFSLAAQNEAGKMVGFLGVEMDPSLGRAWLFGPFVEADDWHILADRIYQAAQELLPPEILDQELCGHVENIRLAEFAQRQGFRVSSEAALLGMPRPAQPGGRASAIEPAPGGPEVEQVRPFAAARSDLLEQQPPVSDATQPDAGQLDALHKSIFPNTYYSAAQLIAMSSEADKRLQVEQVDGELAGYIFVQARPSSKDAFIDFIGVAEPYRRRGIARRLLADALDWAFARPFVEKVTLVVPTANNGAMALYESEGFHTLNVMIAYRKRPL